MTLKVLALWPGSDQDNKCNKGEAGEYEGGMKEQSNIEPTLGGTLIEVVNLERFSHPTHPVREQEGRNEGFSWGSRWIR